MVSGVRMGLKEPASMDECVYFTQRVIKDCKVKAWVLRGTCPSCHKGLMGKPRNPKTGRPKIRASEYTCPDCHHTLDEKTYEESLMASILYTCPHCKHQGETQVPYKRKKVQIFDDADLKKKTIDSLRFFCEKCQKPIDITKKMR